MRKTILFTLLALGTVLVSGVAGRAESKMPLTITPAKLQLFVDQQTDPYTIRVSYILHIPAHYVPSRGRLIFEPHFTDGVHTYSLSPLVVDGKKWKHPGMHSEKGIAGKGNPMYLVSTGDGMQVRLQEVVPFQLWMAQAKLVAGVTLQKGEHRRSHEEMVLADGVIYLPQGPGPVRVKYVDQEVEETAQKRFNFFYPEGKVMLQSAYRQNGVEWQEMKQWIKERQENSTGELKRIEVVGSNTLISRQRIERMQHMLLRQFPGLSGKIHFRYWTEEEIDRNEGDKTKLTCVCFYTHKEKVTRIVPE